MISDIKPFRVAGNVYFVGTYKASSHLIDTGDGLILIDTGYAETAEVILDSMKELGFDIADVKLILHSHGHGDHTFGTPELLRHCQAKTYLHREDMRYIRGRFIPDFFYTDGQIITLGSTSIRVVFTPGHTLGTVSFFFDIIEDGRTLRAAMFGGAGTNQMRKTYLEERGLSYLQRGMFFRTLEKLRREPVDVCIANHCSQNDTPGKLELMRSSGGNPFLDPAEWGALLDRVGQIHAENIRAESRSHFINYAHRGASEYWPENTLSSFDAGLEMGANGIETDVQITKDGIPVLFHDNTLTRVTGQEGSIADYTFDELQAFDVRKNDRTDKIVRLDDFLQRYRDREITFAIELKSHGTAEPVADAVRRFGLSRRCVITSFRFDELCALRSYAPELRTGFLTGRVNDEIIDRMLTVGICELCPAAELVTAEKVEEWHHLGFNVRAWGLKNEQLMRAVYDAGADGMTVNFPDRLTAYLAAQKA